MERPGGHAASARLSCLEARSEVMGRRVFLRLTAAATAWTLLSAHTPYRQWTVYRKRYLLILTSKTDAPTFPLGKRVAAMLAARLPESRARVVRAPHTARIASLISTKQMDVAILSRADAQNLMAGRAPFEDYGPVALRIIVALGDHLLICRADFPDRHAYLVASALVGNKAELPVAVSIGAAGKVPVHPGARAYAEGRPAPKKPKSNNRE